MEAQGPAPQAAAGAGDAAAPPLYYPYQRAGFGVRYDGRGVRRRGCVADDAETLLSAYLRDVALDQRERIRALEQTLTLERQRWQQQQGEALQPGSAGDLGGDSPTVGRVVREHAGHTPARPSALPRTGGGRLVSSSSDEEDGARRRRRHRSAASAEQTISSSSAAAGVRGDEGGGGRGKRNNDGGGGEDDGSDSGSASDAGGDAGQKFEHGGAWQHGEVMSRAAEDQQERVRLLQGQSTELSEALGAVTAALEQRDDDCHAWQQRALAAEEALKALQSSLHQPHHYYYQQQQQPPPPQPLLQQQQQQLQRQQQPTAVLGSQFYPPSRSGAAAQPPQPQQTQAPPQPPQPALPAQPALPPPQSSDTTRRRGRIDLTQSSDLLDAGSAGATPSNTLGLALDSSSSGGGGGGGSSAAAARRRGALLSGGGGGTGAAEPPPEVAGNLWQTALRDAVAAGTSGGGGGGTAPTTTADRRAAADLVQASSAAAAAAAGDGDDGSRGTAGAGISEWAEAMHRHAPNGDAERRRRLLQQARAVRQGIPSH
jgi:hypothetical protein